MCSETNFQLQLEGYPTIQMSTDNPVDVLLDVRDFMNKKNVCCLPISLRQTSKLLYVFHELSHEQDTSHCTLDDIFNMYKDVVSFNEMPEERREILFQILDENPDDYYYSVNCAYHLLKSKWFEGGMHDGRQLDDDYGVVRIPNSLLGNRLETLAYVGFYLLKAFPVASDEFISDERLGITQSNAMEFLENIGYNACELENAKKIVWDDEKLLYAFCGLGFPKSEYFHVKARYGKHSGEYPTFDFWYNEHWPVFIYNRRTIRCIENECGQEFHKAIDGYSYVDSEKLTQQRLASFLKRRDKARKRKENSQRYAEELKYRPKTEPTSNSNSGPSVIGGIAKLAGGIASVAAHTALGDSLSHTTYRDRRGGYVGSSDTWHKK